MMTGAKAGAALATGQSVLEYDRQSKAAAEFAAFFTEVLEVTPHA